MNTFEDDAVNDDFEVEITDLEPEEASPISTANRRALSGGCGARFKSFAAIASVKFAERVSKLSTLGSRISFKARGDNAEDTSPNDDFGLEITDLPANDEESRIPAAIAVLRSHISLSPRSNESGNEVVNEDFGVEITDLPASGTDDPITSVGAGEVLGGVGGLVPAHGRRGREGHHGHLITNLGSLHSHLPRKVRMLRMASVGIAILLMLGVVLESVPSARDAVLSLFPRPTPTPTSATVTREFRRSEGFSQVVVIVGGDISISSTPIAGTTVIPWNPDTPVSNVLDPAPQECPFANVPQDPDSVDFPYGNRVGGPPLWVMGFQGAPAKLIGFTRANPPQYGWVRQVTLMLEGNVDGPVMLQGAHLLDETPLLFSDPDSGQSPATFLTLNLDPSSISNADADVQWGIQPVSLYIPAAGCYYLKASWAGGSWEVLFGAGQ